MSNRHRRSRSQAWVQHQLSLWLQFSNGTVLKPTKSIFFWLLRPLGAVSGKADLFPQGCSLSSVRFPKAPCADLESNLTNLSTLPYTNQCGCFLLLLLGTSPVLRYLTVTAPRKSVIGTYTTAKFSASHFPWIPPFLLRFS